VLEVVTDASVARELAAGPPRELTDHVGLARSLPGEPTGERPFLAYAPPEGESLRALVQREKALPSRKALPIAEQLLEALAHVHGKRAYHGRITPESIWIGKDGSVKLHGLGLGPAIDRARKEKLVGEKAAEPPPAESPYTAPEQTRGERVDERADIYAVGIIVHELLTGQATRPEGQVQGVVRAVAQALSRATAPDPTVRLASASDLRALLLGETPGSPRTGRLAARGDDSSAALNWLLTVGAIVLAVAVVAFVIHRVRAGKPTRTPPGPPRPTTVDSPSTASRSIESARLPLPRRFRRVTRLTGHSGAVTALATNASADVLASGSKDGSVRLWSIRDEGRPLDKLDVGGPVTTVGLSPDGSAVTAGVEDGRLVVAGVVERKIRAAVACPAPLVGAPIGADGMTVVVATRAGSVILIRLPEAGASKLDRITEVKPTDKLSAAVAAGSWFAVAGLDGHGRSYALPSATSALDVDHKAPLTAIAASADGRLATAGADGVVKLWSSAGALEGSASAGGPSLFVGLGPQESPFVAFARPGADVNIATVPQGVVVERLSAQTTAGLVLDDGRTVLVGEADGAISIYRAEVAFRWLLIDDGERATRGNGDGRLQPGEAVELECELSTWIAEETGPATVHFAPASAPAGVSVTAADAPLEHFSSQKVLGRVALAVAPDFKGASIPGTLTVTAGGQTLLSESIDLKVEQR
jgi:hypothetical protein